MNQAAPESKPDIAHLTLVPTLITLAVTLLRVWGELRHWSTRWFNPTAGGGAAIIGIVWLVPVFGVYFALKLIRAGMRPASTAKAIGFTILGIVVCYGGVMLAYVPQIKIPAKEPLGYLVMALGAILVFPAWPALFKTLLAYGYGARIPVAILMFFAIRGNWGTHYDALPPEHNGPMTFWPKFLGIAFLPQTIFWVAFTVLIGALAGTITAALSRRGKATTQAAS